MAKIIDYSFSRPNLDQVKAAGYVGIMRYMSWLPNTKCLIKGDNDGPWNLSERDAIRSRGFMLGLNWEFRATDAFDSDGTHHAVEAVRQAKIIGYPQGCAIYYSIADINVLPASIGPIRRYLKNVRIVHDGYYRVGMYGGRYPLTVAFDEGLIDAGWQACAAWGWYQNGPQYPGNKYALASAWQYHNGVTVGGGDCDLNDINPNRPLYIWGSDDEVTLTDPEIQKIVDKLVAVLPKAILDCDYVPSGDPNNVTWALKNILGGEYGVYKKVTEARDAARAAAAVKAVDIDALAVALAAKLPSTGTTTANLATDIKKALKEVLEGGTAAVAVD